MCEYRGTHAGDRHKCANRNASRAVDIVARCDGALRANTKTASIHRSVVEVRQCRYPIPVANRGPRPDLKQLEATHHSEVAYADTFRKHNHVCADQRDTNATRFVQLPVEQPPICPSAEAPRQYHHCHLGSSSGAARHVVGVASLQWRSVTGGTDDIHTRERRPGESVFEIQSRRKGRRVRCGC
jgi:hypothetical protein